MLLNYSRLTKYFDFIKPAKETRTTKAKKNITLLLFFNAFNFVFVLLSIPITLRYLGKEDYGVWITLSSFLLWLNFFDFGIGNGLRNKLAESLAHNNTDIAKRYISTAYLLFTIILAMIWLLFIPFNFFINWGSILNISQARNNEMQILILLLVALFNIQFILKLVTSVLHADQNTAINGLLSFLVNLFTLAATYALLLFTKSSLSFLAYSNTAIPVVIFLIASFYLFSRKYKSIAPTFSGIDLSYVKGLFGLGIKFFVIQVAGLLVFSTQNLIITQIFGPSEVTTYNIAYRYFFFVVMFFNLVLTPLWSAYTEAYVKQDFTWIRKTIRQTINIWVLLSIVVVIMLVVSNYVYKIWIGKDVAIPFHLSLLMAMFVIISNWNNIFAYFLNGVGKITLQFYSAIFVAIISLPLSYLFAKHLTLGSTGVILATCICLIVSAIWSPIQYKKIITGQDKGLWGR